jgi:hypothetical protein
MFTWYHKSVVCYAYLEDLNATSVKEDLSLLCRSRWFTRGWTLQELIAPALVVFFGSDWDEIGSRDDLVAEISEGTGIDRDLFFDGKLSKYSVAQRMSWAAKRQTTRVEDEAYCLLGLFGVNMPLLYGEGKMAFIRLQEEIMRRSDDHSIFVWSMRNTANPGLLAPSPSCFEGARDVRRIEDKENQSPFFLTNKGIQITLPILTLTPEYDLLLYEPMASADPRPRITVTPPESLIAVLSCQDRTGKRIALALDRSEDSDQFHRINVDLGLLLLRAEQWQRNTETKRILVKPYDPVNDFPLGVKLRPTFFGIRGLPSPESGYVLTHKFGNITVEVQGIISAKLWNGNRVGVIYSHANADSAFGIFLGETDFKSAWEIVTGSRAAVERKYYKFQYKDNRFLTSLASWKLPLGYPQSETLLQVTLETQRRHHGFSGLITIEERNGHDFTPRPPCTDEQLVALAEMAMEAGVESIGFKHTRTSLDMLGTKFPSRKK